MVLLVVMAVDAVDVVVVEVVVVDVVVVEVVVVDVVVVVVAVVVVAVFVFVVTVTVVALVVVFDVTVTVVLVFVVAVTVVKVVVLTVTVVLLVVVVDAVWQLLPCHVAAQLHLQLPPVPDALPPFTHGLPFAPFLHACAVAHMSLIDAHPFGPHPSTQIQNKFLLPVPPLSRFHLVCPRPLHVALQCTAAATNIIIARIGEPTAPPIPTISTFASVPLLAKSTRTAANLSETAASSQCSERDGRLKRLIQEYDFVPLGC